ncbi:hypothetical protein SK128_022972, partial [Halocaridina rubra]
DSVEWRCKIPTYFVNHYPIDIDNSLAKELPGICTVHHFHQNGMPINRLVITWRLPEQPLPIIDFSFFTSLLACELCRMKDEQTWCFRCRGIGHISCYCSVPEKCAWCTANHASRSRPYRTPSLPSAATASASVMDSSPPPATDTSQWN